MKPLSQSSEVWKICGLGRRPWARRPLAVTLALALQLLQLQRGRAENHVDARYEDYQEEDGRMHVQTLALDSDLQLTPSVSAHGEFVYDAVSGATPNGGLPVAGDRGWLSEIEPDERKAFNLAASVGWGRNATTPQFAYSLENDYESFGYSLNHTIDFNEKNTTLAIGAAYTHDNIFAATLSSTRHKDSGDFLLGVTQLLGPKTVLTANFTVGTAHGYLNDPYKSIHIPYYPDPANPDPFARTQAGDNGERRPGTRNKQIGYVSLTQFFTPVNGSAELGYRLYHDSYGILSHTVSLSWYQKLGKHFVVSPLFRFMDQNAADFYMIQLPGDYTLNDPGDPYYAPLPNYFSSDYRLAAMQTFTYGISVTAKIKDRVSVDLAYKRYDTFGTDGVTSPLLFPKANVVSVGFRLWF
jgi:hypothetical protein